MYPAIKLYPLNVWGADGKIGLVYSLRAHTTDSDGKWGGLAGEGSQKDSL
jgi:hypothetical protein